MMSSSPAFDFLDGSHNLYKANTAAVLLYLVEEARSNGVAIPKRANTPADARDENAYLVAVNDIVPFAQCVMAASEKPTPDVVLRSLCRTIRSRRRCNVWYRGQTICDASLESSNTSHQHFNNVLDELFDVLTQHYIQYSRERIEVIKGIFDCNLAGKSASYILEIERRSSYGEDEQVIFGVVENPESKPVAENKFKDGKKPELPADYQVEEPIPENKSTKGKKPEPPAVYQVEGSTDDMRFAMFNLFKDLGQIRQYVYGLLRQYRAGEVGLVLIRAVIKSAIGIVRIIETKFLRSLPQPRFSSWEDIMSIIASPAQFQAISKGLSDNSELEFIHSIYGLTFQQLRQFRESLKAGAFPSYPIDRVSLLDPEPSYLAFRLRQTTILQEYLQEVALLGGGENLNLASEDELTRAIIDVFEGARGSFKCKAGTIHLWIVFGLEVFLDTQEHLGPIETLSSWEVTATGDVYRPKIEDDLEDPADIEKVNYSKMNWIDRDEFVELRRVGKLPLGGLSQNPVVCGSMQCRIFAKSQSDEITMLKRSLLGTAAACLYNAVRKEGYLDLPWQDMELLIENYDSAKIFDGQPPKDAKDAKDYYNHFAKSIDSYYVKKSGKKRKSQVSEILKPFEKLLCQTDPAKTEISVDVIEEFLHRTAHLQGIRKKKQDALRDHWNKNHTLKPTELLTLLKECLNENEPMLHFNHYAFYKSCFLLLRLVEEELCDEFNTFMSTLPFPFCGHMDEDFSWLSAMVLLEFHVTMEPKHGPPPDKWLVRVAGVFKKFIQRYAGKPDGKMISDCDDEGVQNGVCIHWGPCKRLGNIHSP